MSSGSFQYTSRHDASCSVAPGSANSQEACVASAERLAARRASVTWLRWAIWCRARMRKLPP